jgi:hypothetical protein
MNKSLTRSAHFLISQEGRYCELPHISILLKHVQEKGTRVAETSHILLSINAAVSHNLLLPHQHWWKGSSLTEEGCIFLIPYVNNVTVPYQNREQPYDKT